MIIASFCVCSHSKMFATRRHYNYWENGYWWEGCWVKEGVLSVLPTPLQMQQAAPYQAKSNSGPSMSCHAGTSTHWSDPGDGVGVGSGSEGLQFQLQPWVEHLPSRGTKGQFRRNRCFNLRVLTGKRDDGASLKLTHMCVRDCAVINGG